MASAATALIPEPQARTYSQDELFETLYRNLRSQALFYLHREHRGHSLSPTVLVHEAYLALAKTAGPQIIDTRHFVHLAGRVMRNWLTDWARRKIAVVHGGGLERIDIEDSNLGVAKDPTTVILVSRALDQLEATRPELARIVELRYFAGFDEEETAQVIGLSVRQTRRKWAVAKALLLDLIG